MKILSLNAGYFLGYDGYARNYIRHPLRGVFGQKKVQEESVGEFSDILENEDPRAVLLQEIDTGSIRTIKEALPQNISKMNSDAANKYSGLFSKTPFLRHMSNAVLHTNGEVENQYLKHGNKALVQELRLKDLSIFSVHLSVLSPKIRQKQLKEISDITSERQKFVLAGDFNFLKGQSEIDNAVSSTNWQLSCPGETFPAKNPTKPLDMAFHSENISINTRTLDANLSDHRPIIIEIEI